MLDVGIFSVFFDPKFLVAAIVAVFAFATVVTLGLPMLDRNQLGSRMKAVSERREELRLRHHASLNKRGSLRSEPVSFMKATVERFKLSNILESEGTREKAIPRPSSWSGKTESVRTNSSLARAWIFRPPACASKFRSQSTNRPM